MGLNPRPPKSRPTLAMRRLDLVTTDGTREQSVNGNPLRPEGDARCATHSHKKVTFVCYDCNSLVCGKCVTSIHHGHIMEELSDAWPSIKNKLDLSINFMETEQLPRVQSCIELTEQRLLDNTKQIKDIVCVMKLQANKCKDELDDMVDECVSVCEKLGKENMELLLKYMAEHKARLQDLIEQIKYRRHVMLTGSNINMFDALCNVPTYDAIECPSLHTAHFSPCEVVTDLLKQALGQLTTSFDSQHPSTKQCQSGPESQVSNVVIERSVNEPSPTANGNTLESTDQSEG
ncbi:uncharacterized protein LOC117330132 [Pecten maximus]|uniref:uncharacterized protein LOC117330132 n=1 Tax=Pecten maximus TaxID=6579 RepID=UPI0014585171|nr:uncharacterized protein LOC117330132 [Pecten maximus]